MISADPEDTADRAGSDIRSENTDGDVSHFRENIAVSVVYRSSGFIIRGRGV